MNENLKKNIKKIKEFPLEECGPGDDSDKKYAYVQNFKSITETLRIWLAQIENKDIEKYIRDINWDFECISEAHQTKIKLNAIFEFIEALEFSNSDIILNKLKISQNKADQIMKMKEEIVEFLYFEKATILPDICVSLGLKEGDSDEAFNSKKSYIRKRLLPLDAMALLKVLKEIRNRYPESEISYKINGILENSSLKITNDFEKISKTIISELETAEFTIWIAMAWLTNKEILRTLYKKKMQGLNIQLVLNDDDINNGVKDKNDKKIMDYFEVYKNQDNKNLMHNKFCIIDLKKVITGSYNWTNKARYNDENIVLIESMTTAQEYANNFKKIKIKIIKKLLD